MNHEKVLLRSHLKTLTLLCVDNSEVTNTIYRDIFGILFKDVILVKTAQKALQILEKNSVDLILTEHVLNGMSGMDMISIIRETNQNIPIILVSVFEDINLLTKALHFNIQNFVKKPFEATDLLDAIEKAVRLLLADKYLQEQKQKELQKLEDKVKYSDYQEKLALRKELKIARNDFYYKYLSLFSGESFLIIDFLYAAKDTLSGDSFSARKIKNQNIFVVVDGMGKGVSASLSAIVFVTFINRIIDRAIEQKKGIDLRDLIHRTIQGLQTILFEEENLSAVIMLFDDNKHEIEYASFSMPPVLLMDERNDIKQLKSNNPPINPYVNSINIDKFSSIFIQKMLMYSDGLVENSLKNENETYIKYIKEDFKCAISREDFRQRFSSKIAKQEDDITFIFLHEINLERRLFFKEIETKLAEIENMQVWFEGEIAKICEDEKDVDSATLAFNELLMNAYEHGNLGIKRIQKHQLIENDEYFEYILAKEKKCNKKIKIKASLYESLERKTYLIVGIKDEGDGFDTAMLSNIFGVHKSYNQRGILMSRNSTLGIYYNDKANKVVFISKL